MIDDVANELAHIVEPSVKRLLKIDESSARVKSNPTKWSIQEILVHLIDSSETSIWAEKHLRLLLPTGLNMKTFGQVSMMS